MNHAAEIRNTLEVLILSLLVATICIGVYLSTGMANTVAMDKQILKNQEDIAIQIEEINVNLKNLELIED